MALRLQRPLGAVPPAGGLTDLGGGGGGGGGTTDFTTASIQTDELIGYAYDTGTDTFRGFVIKQTEDNLGESSLTTAVTRLALIASDGTTTAPYSPGALGHEIKPPATGQSAAPERLIGRGPTDPPDPLTSTFLIWTNPATGKVSANVGFSWVESN